MLDAEGVESDVGGWARLNPAEAGFVGRCVFDLFMENERKVA